MARYTMVVAMVVGLLISSMALAQQDNRGGQRGARGGGAAAERRAPGGGEGQGQGRGAFDPAAMRQRMMQQLKEQLGASDEEFAVIEPKLEKVMTLRNQGGGFGGGAGFGAGPGGRRGGEGQAANPVAQAQRDLRTALDNESASAEEIASKLAALRQAREKARQDLEAAQKDLKEVLTQRQEALLVSRGLLD